MTAGSNGLVFATAARLTVPVVAEVNGPVASGMPKNNPGATSGASRSVAVLTMIRSTCAGEGSLPWWVLA